MTPAPPRSSSGSGRGASPGAKCDGRGIALQSNSLLLEFRFSAKPSRLIEPSTSKRSTRRRQNRVRRSSRPRTRSARSALGDQALRMKVRDAVDELLPKQEIERRDEMQHQRRAAGKEDRIRPPHRLKTRRAATAGSRAPSRQPCHELLFLVGRADGCGQSQASHRRSARRPSRLSLPLVKPTSVTCPALARPLAREQHRILSDRTEIRRQPVANVNEPLHCICRTSRWMLQDADATCSRVLTVGLSARPQNWQRSRPRFAHSASLGR